MEINKKHSILLLMILVLSAYVHLWNPVGFPDIFFDEGIYMRRAMTVLETGNPQEGYLYDHPYFGQLVLGGILKLTGFGEIVQNDLEMSYLVPRVLMGLFAVLDTFLIYKITSKKFSKSTAILASILFAVMPVTWLLRRILLDNIMLPLILSSILLALYSKDSKHQNLMIIGSSVLLGLAVFTKLTAITMIPIVLFLFYSALHDKWKSTILALPIFTIPGIWPLYAMLNNQLDLWIKDVFWQAGRGQSGAFLVITSYIFDIDPVFTVLGFAGLFFAIYKKSMFLLLWFVPFLIFVNLVGFLQYFHFILILPVMAIAAAYLIQSTLYRIKRWDKMPFYVILTLVIIFGVDSSSSLINLDLTDSQFTVMEAVNEEMKKDKEITLLAGPVYSWIFSDLYGYENVMLDYSLVLFEKPPTDKHLVIADPHFLLDIQRGKELQDLNNYDTYFAVQNPNYIDTNKYPFTSLKFTQESTDIRIKTNFHNDVR